MANSHNIFPCLSILSLLTTFSPLLIPAYAFPDHTFINCGSAVTLTLYNLVNFTGDDGAHSDRYKLHSNDGSKVVTSSSAPHQLYRSAMRFRKPSCYEFHFNTDENGTYTMRLHFFPFPAMGNLSDARFSVSVSTPPSTLSLLSELEFQNSSLPLIKEFFLNVTTRNLRIRFAPDNKRGKKAFAFVNAIELFLTPLEFVGVLDSPLRVAHRINVGGGDVPREMDTMTRLWIPDDAYLLFHNSTAMNRSSAGKVNYKSCCATESDAPDFVYNTAKVMNVSNISWRFEVAKGVRHLVRLHFCDIVSLTSNEGLVFDLHIYGGLSKEVSPWDITNGEIAAPFYMDFVVVSDYSGFMDISVGPNKQSDVRTAFLNGVEIMEMMSTVSVDSNDSTGRGLHLHMIIGWSIGVVVLVALIAFISFLRRNKLGGTSDRSKTNYVSSVAGSIHGDLNLGLKMPLSSILFATRRFSAELMIGEGGFGKVYKGKLRRGTKVAVKRSEAGHGQGLEEFHTEIRVLSKIRHQHLVSLIGYCDERDEMILVYEFMEKGTLRDHLYASQGEAKTVSPFSWEQRLRICIGAAKGLDYLHTGCTEAIVHRDIKSTNILLDENYMAKVADFGLSRMVPLDHTHFTTQVKGSFGYMDPEYYSCFQLTPKSDVYSFGVVLLEVLCARPAVDSSLPMEQVGLAEWGMSWQTKGQLESIVDPFLEGKIDPDSLRIFGETVERCLQESGADRPLMSEVLWSLEHCLQLQELRYGHRLRQQPHEDSAMGLPAYVVRRLPSSSISVSEDEMALRCYSFSDEREVDVSSHVVFSQLGVGSAR